MIVGKDGIGLSLTGTPQKCGDDVGIISSSLISCSFVNMSSIGSSRQPYVPHMHQKMLGCVVSLTSSHLSGSTIRDVNNGGSFLCSNSSFSSLLSSPNTDPNSSPSIILDDETTLPFADSTKYKFDSNTQSTSISISHCPFTGANYASARPLTFDKYSGTISILSCSFVNIQSDDQLGGPVSLNNENIESQQIEVRLCNFTSCTSLNNGAGMYLSHGSVASVVDCRFVECGPAPSSTGLSGGGLRFVASSGSTESLLTGLHFSFCSATTFAGGLYLTSNNKLTLKSCRFSNCSSTSPTSTAGGLYYAQLSPLGSQVLANLIFEDCASGQMAGGLNLMYQTALSLVDTQFIRCKTTLMDPFSVGGGLSSTVSQPLELIGCEFVNCSTPSAGGAVFLIVSSEFSMEDCVVKECSSGSTGAITLYPFLMSGPRPASFTRVQFIENRVDNSRLYFNTPLTENATAFADLYVDLQAFHVIPELSFDECFTTITPDSAGLFKVVVVEGEDGPVNVFERAEEAAFDKIGPNLTEKATVEFDATSGRMRLEMKGNVPIASQKYKVTIRDDENPSEIKGEIEFLDGTGTFVSSSNENLKFNTRYTITSIVGVVPTSSSSSSSTSPTSTAGGLYYAQLSPLGSQVLANLIFEDCASGQMAGGLNLMYQQPLSLVDTQFIRCKTTLMDPFSVGGGLSSTVSQPLELIGCEFVNCSTPSAGGAVFLIVSSEFSMEDCVVKECSSGSTGAITLYPFLMSGPRPASFTRVQFIENRVDNSRLYFNTPLTENATAFADLYVDLQAFHVIPELSFDECFTTITPDSAGLFKVVVVEGEDGPVNVFERAEEAAFDKIGPNLTEKATVEFDATSGRMRLEMKGNVPIASQKYKVTIRDDENPSEIKGEIEFLDGTGTFVSSSNENLKFNTQKREMPKRALGLQLVNGLKAVLANRQASDVLTRLSSHWILIDTAGNAQLKLQMNAEEAQLEAAHAKQQPATLEASSSQQNQPKDLGQAGMDGLRWRAPEVVASGGSVVDGHKAAVFSLGLVLWEIETGQVPFGELDAVNAQRQSGTGIGPKMDSLRNDEFIALIRQCLSANPEQRPSLSEIGEFLSTHPEDSNVLSHNELKDPAQ
ncbi:hypothetical protein BLNAU_19778 [Blattamonas nauphoetae]|uniref:Protein kinase domain-containing protein n=1 Tax=Blattamonas nauphoetae TaxID=2049346 RepID=A0ABQ9X0Q3_9EUKA|nr:hypothetical protein BLNAU_19778 [Blattamonas nauphoetae]